MPLLPRLFVDRPLAAGAVLTLPPGPARHVQVLRLQPGAPLVVFDGSGGEWRATLASIGRREVSVELGAHAAAERELPFGVTLALGMPANERMDFVIEKATELGVAAIQPLACARSVLRLDDARAARKVMHWQAIAVAAAEQSGRTRVPVVRPVRPVLPIESWANETGHAPRAGQVRRWLLAFEDAQPVADAAPRRTAETAVVCLSGPEGGLTPDEEGAARAAGFVGVSLGSRVLRADTAPLAVLAYLGLGGWR